MVEKQKYQAYAVATQTVAPSRQIVMLYDGIIRCLSKAREAIAEKRIEERYNLLIRASELIGGLQGCLDFDKGGEVAKVLYSYYSGIDARVFSLHRTGSLQDCDSIILDVKQMRDAWDEIDRGGNEFLPNQEVYSEKMQAAEKIIDSNAAQYVPEAVGSMSVSA